MNFDWGTIKPILKLYCVNAYTETNYAMSEQEIDDNLNIYHNLINMVCPYALLSAYGKDARDSLQKCCVTEIGSSNQLKVFLTSIDSFLKRIILFAHIDSYNNIHSNKLMKLVKDLRIFSSIPNLNTVSFDSFKTDGSGLYTFAKTWEARNKETHNSPSWDTSTVTQYFKFSIAFIVIVISKLKISLLQFNPDIITVQPSLDSSDSKEEFRAYDFINFGRTSNEIRTQIIDCYILHYIRNNGAVKETDLISEVQKFIGNSDTKISGKSAIRRLITKGKVMIVNSNEIALTTSETARLDENTKNYMENRRLFNESLHEILVSFSIEKNIDKVIDVFSTFLYENIALIFDESIVPPANLPTSNSVANLFSVLKSLLNDDKKVNDLYIKLIELCRDNDILVRLSLGKAYGALSNPERFSQYVKNHSRIVYLDTHILLHIICLNDEFPACDIWAFRIGKTLIDISYKQKGLILKFGSQYIGEVVFHLKNALKLIHLEEISQFKNGIPTNNVFYIHYLSLLKENLLPEDITNFADYLEAQFSLTENDLEDPHFRSIAQKCIEDKLSEINILLEEIPYYTEDDIAPTKDIFSEALKQTNIEKKFHVFNNDVIMGHFLFEESKNYEPFFLTQDRSFAVFRRLYIEKFLRRSFWAWHLFTPSKFVTHLELLEFKIDIDNISDDLLSLIESDSIKDKSISFVDINNRLIEINGLTPVKRREYSKLNFELLKGFEFGSIDEDNLSVNPLSPERIGLIWDDIRLYVSSLGAVVENKFFNLLLDKENYGFLISNIHDYLNNIIQDKTNLMKKIGELLEVKDNDCIQ